MPKEKSKDSVIFVESSTLVISWKECEGKIGLSVRITLGDFGLARRSGTEVEQAVDEK